MPRVLLAAARCRQLRVWSRLSGYLVLHPVLTPTPTKEDFTRLLQADIFCRFLRETGETATLHTLELTAKPEIYREQIGRFGIDCEPVQTGLERQGSVI